MARKKQPNFYGAALLILAESIKLGPERKKCPVCFRYHNEPLCEKK